MKEQRISFVVRLWVEPRQEEGRPRWRGQIEQVGSGEQAYFRDVEGLLAAMAKSAPGFITSGAHTKEES
jgi:hypothetical protein